MERINIEKKKFHNGNGDSGIFNGSCVKNGYAKIIE